jgi:hypothetical protein
MDKLKYLSLRLKNYPMSERKPILKTSLAEINDWIEKTVRGKISFVQTACKYKYYGIQMPLDEGDDEDPRIIMSFIPDLIIPFDTKKRAPFRCVFETVKLSEL